MWKAFPTMTVAINLMKLAVFLSVLHMCIGVTFDCRTDETCKSVSDCARSRTDFQTRIFVMCSYDNQEVKVCCPPPNKVSRTMAQPHRNFHLLSRFCGQTTESLRITNGNDASIGQFPWMALLKHQDHDSGEYKFFCAGAVINRRYILTSAHCLDTDGLRVKGVLLGDLDLNTDPDCEDFCADPVLEMGVQTIIIHRRFTPTSLRNDIGLIRVNSNIPFTDYIQPICLPFQNAAPADRTETYVFAGWGQKDDRDASGSSILQFAKVHVTPVSQCEEFQPDIFVPLSRTTQMCAGGAEADFCPGDSGGPLVKLFNDGTPAQVVGIASHRSVPECGVAPSVYTKVQFYIEWILDNIKP